MKNKIVRLLQSSIMVCTVIAVVSTKPAYEDPSSTRWKIEDTSKIAELKPLVLGNPVPVADIDGKYLYFDGVDDGLIVSKIPIEGWKQFTIEVLFKPKGDGPREPRFIHFEDKELNRGTFEIRLNGQDKWYMDTFLKNGKTNRGLTLIDSTRLHRADKWYWVAMVYDGSKMTSYVNGQKELDGEIDFPPMVAGSIAFGARLNKVNWFKGAIREIRFHPAALTKERLQQL